MCLELQEIFDEVSEENIFPTWDLDMEKLIVGIENSLNLTFEIADIEKSTAKVLNYFEKSLLNAFIVVILECV